MGPDSHGDRENRRHGDGDATDQQDEKVIYSLAIMPSL